MIETVQREQEIFPFDWSLIKAYKPLYVRYPAGELIYKRGSYVAGVYLISDGLVSDHCEPTKNRGSQEVSSEILGPGDLIGLDTFLEQRTDLHFSCAHAVTDVKLCFFRRETFLKMLQEKQEITRYCLNSLSRRFYYLKQWYSDFFNLPLEARLARLLLSFAEKCVQEEEEVVSLPPEITRTMLSRLLSVTTAKVTETLLSFPEISLGRKQIAISLEPLRLRLTSMEI